MFKNHLNTRRHKFLLLLTVLLFCCFYLVNHKNSLENELNEFGVLTKTQVIKLKKNVEENRGNVISPYKRVRIKIKYKYIVDNSVYYGRASSEDNFNVKFSRLMPSDSITVMYSSQNPRLNTLNFSYKTNH